MEFEQYLSKLPEYDFAITYGSGVFKQIGYSEKDHKNAMLDVIIGVRNPIEWHRVNMQLNPEHYSFFRHLGSSTIAKLENFGLGHVYYNTTVMGPSGHERPVKYGVIEMEKLKHDLLEWDSLYVSGRLQKPVRLLRGSPAIIDAMNHNLRSAILAVLPLLPLQFSSYQLFIAITRLSYNGDIRTYFAENPHKVQNIVEGNFDNFCQLYKPFLDDCPLIHPIQGREGWFEQDVSIPNLARIAASLPSSLHSSVRAQLEFGPRVVNVEGLSTELLRDLYERRLTALFDPGMKNENLVAAKGAVARGIQMGVRRVVFRGSVDQAVRGVASFGVWNSVTYAAKKIMKFLK